MIAAIPAFVVTAAAAATDEKKSGLPQLNPADFSPQLIWLALTFVVLYLILARVALPRIGEVLDERREREGVVDGQGYARQARCRIHQGARAGGRRACREACRGRGAHCQHQSQ